MQRHFDTSVAGNFWNHSGTGEIDHNKLTFIHLQSYFDASADHVWPFPTYNKSAAEDFENIVTKTWKITIKDGLIVK